MRTVERRQRAPLVAGTSASTLMLQLHALERALRAAVLRRAVHHPSRAIVGPRGRGCYAALMRVARGKVVGNTVVLEEDLPEGAEVDVVLREAGDDVEANVTDAEWEALLAAAAQARQGRLVSAESVLAKLRAQR